VSVALSAALLDCVAMVIIPSGLFNATTEMICHPIINPGMYEREVQIFSDSD
jgi:hypothetical protein